MAVIRSVPSQPPWEDLLKILIKVYKLKESTETILVFDNYIDELEYSLKELERSDRAGSTAPLQTYIGEVSQEMLQEMHQKQISATEKVHRISYTWKHTEKFNGSYNFECRERYSIDITISTTKSFLHQI